MGWLKYFWKVLRKAWPDSWGWTQNLVVAGTLLCGGIVDWWPDVWATSLKPYTKDFPLLSDGTPDMTGWQVTLTLLAVIVIARIIWAAYRLQADTEAKLEGESLKNRELEMLERHHQERVESERKNRVVQQGMGHFATYGRGKKPD